MEAEEAHTKKKKKKKKLKPFFKAKLTLEI